MIDRGADPHDDSLRSDAPGYSDALIGRLRCPRTGLGYRRVDAQLVRADGDVLARRARIASFADPALLVGSDARLQQRYQWLAPWYDRGERVLGRLLTGVDMVASRARIVMHCGYVPGSCLLEVSPGPGVFLPALREALGDTAPIVGLDLSLAMLLQYRQRADAGGVELVHGNAQALPFGDAAFDALFHFGGVNLFNDPDRALAEFVRVVRPGGRIAWGDERMSPGFTRPVARWLLPRMNPGFRRTPPAPPAGVRVLATHEVHGGLGYLVVADRDG